MTNRPIDVALTDRERDFLAQGIFQWGGPIRCHDAAAILIGYDGCAAMDGDRHRLAKAVQDGGALSALDWRRALTATEISFASDRYGAGAEWSTVAPFTDAESIELLRVIQRALASVVRA